MKKRTTKKKINLKIFAKRLLLVGLAVYVCVTLIGQQSDLSNLKAQEKVLDAQILAAQKEAKELEAEKSISGTDEYIEHVARERLGFMKKFEKVFVDTNK